MFENECAMVSRAAKPQFPRPATHENLNVGCDEDGGPKIRARLAIDKLQGLRSQRVSPNRVSEIPLEGSMTAGDDVISQSGPT
jgi:hypothetical protein